MNYKIAIQEFFNKSRVKATFNQLKSNLFMLHLLLQPYFGKLSLCYFSIIIFCNASDLPVRLQNFYDENPFALVHSIYYNHGGNYRITLYNIYIQRLSKPDILVDYKWFDGFHFKPCLTELVNRSPGYTSALNNHITFFPDDFVSVNSRRVIQDVSLDFVKTNNYRSLQNILTYHVDESRFEFMPKQTLINIRRQGVPGYIFLKIDDPTYSAPDL